MKVLTASLICFLFLANAYSASTGSPKTGSASPNPTSGPSESPMPELKQTNSILNDPVFQEKILNSKYLYKPIVVPKIYEWNWKIKPQSKSPHCISREILDECHNALSIIAFRHEFLCKIITHSVHCDRAIDYFTS
jgi:hypothetical protein